MTIGRSCKQLLVLLLSVGALLVGAAVHGQSTFPSSPPPFYPPVPSAPPPYKPIPPQAPSQPGPPGSHVPYTGHREQGVINPRTGEFYPGTYGGVVDPSTGVVLPKVDGGYVNPQTGEVIPRRE